MSLADKALEIAKTQLGKEENPRGSNWGKPVQDYLERVGIAFPASWCAAFVYWCFDEAAKASTVKNPLYKTGGVLMQWQKSKSAFAVTGKPQVGDMFIMDFGGGLGHTGFVEKVDGENFYSIEGNSNDHGSREGFEVCRRVRKIKSCKGFLRFTTVERLPMEDVKKEMKTTANLNLRTAPSTDSKIIDTLPKGTIVTVIDDHSDWDYVVVKEKKGWVSSKYLE